MPTTKPVPSRLRGTAVALAMLVLAAPLAARADSVWTLASGANAKPFPRHKVKIEALLPEGLVFRSVSADRAAEPRPLSEIYRIEVDDEPALTAAESAFVASKWGDAIAGYQKAMSASRKDWVKQYASLRLMSAAEKSGKLSAAASAYVALVQQDLRTAMKAKPEVNAGAKAELPAAINAVKAGLAAPKLQPPQRNALQAFLAELYIANGQAKEAQAVAAGKAPPAPAGAPARTESPAAPANSAARATPADRSQAELKLQLAVASIRQKKFQEAIDQIDEIAPTLAEPDQQANALFTLAEARAGLAGDDPDKLKDAALAYMRVVAHFRGEAAAPRVAEALLRTGTVLEQAKLLPDALAAYQAVQTDYKDSPHAKDAAAGAARVKKAIDETRG